MADSPVLALHNVSKRYPARGRAAPWQKRLHVQALDDINLNIGAREIVGLVGESGSGKSTLGRLIVGLEPASSGKIVYTPEDSGVLPHTVPLIGPQMTFQNPTDSLNPRQRVRDIIAEPLRVHGSAVDIECAVQQMMEKVGLPPEVADRFSHEISGGQCQRVGIARALMLGPSLLVCDEPVSALDVSIQAQILNLFADLQEDTGCSYLFISHDLPVVELLSHRIVIMYLGRVVEIAPTEALFGEPAHPYTRALIDSAPGIDARTRTFHPIKGEIPSPLRPPTGCHFHPRCPSAIDRCRQERPALREISRGRHAACHLS